MIRRVNKDVDQIVDRLTRDHGCKARLTKGGHWQVTRPGHGVVTVSATPSDRRALHKILGDIRRTLGVDLKR